MRVEQQNINIVDTLQQNIGPKETESSILFQNEIAAKKSEKTITKSVNLKDVTYLKPGQEEKESAVDKLEQSSVKKIFICAEYVYEEEFLQIRYNEIDINSNAVEKEDNPVNYYSSGNIEHYLVSDLGRTKAVWQNGILESRIAGNVTEEEMIQMIDSVYKESGK